MSCRPHGRKHTMALWMLVAAADLGIVVSSGGATAALLLALAVAVVAGLVVTARILLRRAHPVAPVTRGIRSWQQARAQTEGQIWQETRA